MTRYAIQRRSDGRFWAGTLYKSEKPMLAFQASSDAQAAPKVSFAPPANQ